MREKIRDKERLFHIMEIVWATIQDNLLQLQEQIKQMIFSQTK